MKINNKIAKTIKYSLVVLLLAFVLLPFYWIFISSMKPTAELVRSIPTFIPEKWVFTHYYNLFAVSKYMNYLVNSFFVSIITTFITIILATLAGYSLYRCKYPGRKFISSSILAIYVFPQVLLLMPLYEIMNKLNLINSLWSLVIINVTIASPFSVWLLRSFFNSIPEGIEEAALIDGASRFKILYKIFIPLVAPGISTIAIFTFLFSWTEYLFSNVFILDESLKTLPIGLSRFITQYQVDWGLLNAGAIVTAIPPLVVFALVGKYFIEGLTNGSVK